MANTIKNLTLSGRLSYPVFTYQEALNRNEKSDYKKDDLSKVAPEYNILLDQAGLDKALEYMTEEFLPWVAAQHKAGEKRFEKMDAAAIKKLEAALQEQDWEDQPPYLPIKPVPKKTKEMAPEAVAMFKVLGRAGEDLEQKAIVRSDEELLEPGNDIITKPVIRDIKDTVHELYAGAVVGTTLNLYTYINGKTPGIGAGGPKLVFKADAEPFGGNVVLDEDALFED